MKKVLVVVFVVLVLGGVLIYLSQKNTSQITLPTESLAPTTSTLSFCTSDQLSPAIALDPGAGNIYGTLSIKNISDKSCQVQGNKFISVTYDTQNIKNLSLKQTGEAGASIIELTPNQSVYSQIHYPNGPQCGGPLVYAKITFDYEFSPNQKLSFTTPEGDTVIPTCENVSDMTTIDVWSVFTSPITSN